MDLTRTPVQLADDAAEAIRSLCHVTIPQDAYKEPADINATIARLEGMIHSLPQALGQTVRTLQAMDEKPGIRIDSGADSAEKVAEAIHAVASAMQHLQSAGRALSQTTQLTSTMGWHFTPAADQDGDA